LFEAERSGNFKAYSRARHALAQARRLILPSHPADTIRKVSVVTSSIIEFMLTRSSAPIKDLSEPAPNDAQIETLIKIASRVPDHGRLTPWRFIIYRGDARIRIGEKLAALAQEREGPLNEARREQELTRFSRAPLVIGVISCPKENPKIPQSEMLLSGGAAAMNLVIAANALGYKTNWITNWYSEVEEGRRILGLAPHERVVGFVHIGSFEGPVPERPRPDVSQLYSEYTGPWQG
jgi:nitroreductase